MISNRRPATAPEHSLPRGNGQQRRRFKMTKELRCKDLGMDCAVVMQADTEAELLKQAADHAKKVHHIDKLDDKMMEKARKAIHDTKK